jgi:hypothetical protein
MAYLLGVSRPRNLLMRLPNLLLLSLVFIACLRTHAATAASLDDLKLAIDSYNRSKICPAGEQYNIHDYKVFCKEWCDQSRVCNTATSSDPCELGDREKCHALAEGSLQCLTQMNAENKTILEYNRIAEKCPHGTAGAAENTTSLLQQTQEAQQSTASSLGQAVTNEATTMLGELAAKDQNTARKDAINADTASCENRVETCRQSYDALPYLTDETKDQCNAYCTNLGVEACRSSDTIRAGANACSQAATLDYKNALSAREAERQRAREQNASPAPPPRQTAPAVQEWTCFPSYESCTGYCMQQTGASGTGGWCGGICSGDGTGNRPQPSEYSGQYCYHAPVTPEERANVY